MNQQQTLPLEEIKKLAEEYAENVKSEYVSANLIETLVMGFYHSRLKRNYCIVEKTRVKEAMKYPQRHVEPIQDTMCVQVLGVKKVLTDLFGKELFNEEQQ